ncbi:MAG: hypothetical protein JKY48_16495 [Flavobacteriales bacterium]|nr:hypothetical protein [Flavobacteriales bacterium]
MIFSILISSCEDEKEEPAIAPNLDYEIILYQYQNDVEIKAEFETGLQWCFSYLGAQLEKGSWAKGTSWLDTQRIQIDVEEFGFDQTALQSLKELISIYKQSEEYSVTGGIDAGRFVVSIFNNSNHYYKIVGMPSVLNNFVSDYTFLQKKAAIIESAVAFGERIINIPQEDGNIHSLGYLAEEIIGSLSDSSHVVKENEVMDIMPNGQLRFGIYNANKELITGADTTLSIAGKPAKCLWCHEVNIQTAIAALTAIPGYYSPPQFDSVINQNRTILEAYRASLNTEIDFNDISQHAELEKLYIRFMEPSTKRLSGEWSITEQEVKSRLSNLSTHINHEFPELGNLYHRTEVETYSPYQVIRSTSSARETVLNEPNLLL